MTRREILARHKTSVQGTLRSCLLSSQTLGIRKSFYVYEPPGLNGLVDVPMLYLFRGHEREWVNFNEDSSRTRTTAIEDLDAAITMGMLPPLVAVMPGLNSSNNHIPSLGINMAGLWPPSMRGLGTGKFWEFLTSELMPALQMRYPNATGPKLAAGFSLGGFTTSLLTIQKPELFDHVGIYDGLFMWPKHHDPRQPVDPTQNLGNDTIWTEGGLFHAAFGNPRHIEAMQYWNPTDRLIAIGEQTLCSLRETTWWIKCAASDGRHGNRDRAEFYQELLSEKGIPLGYEKVLFDENAAHSWHWTDKFLMSFLSSVFS